MPPAGWIIVSSSTSRAPTRTSCSHVPHSLILDDRMQLPRPGRLILSSTRQAKLAHFIHKYTTCACIACVFGSDRSYSAGFSPSIVPIRSLPATIPTSVSVSDDVRRQGLIDYDLLAATHQGSAGPGSDCES